MINFALFCFENQKYQDFHTVISYYHNYSYLHFHKFHSNQKIYIPYSNVYKEIKTEEKILN